LERSIAENGGDRIEQLGRDIASREDQRDGCLRRAERYAELAQATGLRPVDNAEVFLSQKKGLAALREAAAREEAELQNRQSEAQVAEARIEQEHRELAAEIESLRSRRSNIDSRQVAMRDAICDELGIPAGQRAAQMPFAGDLLQVREEDIDWEGAIERLLRGFGLSMLVKDEHYARVAQWVDRTHLQGRLVYFRVRPGVRADFAEPRPDSLARKLAVKPDSFFYGWLEHEVARRYADVACCATQEQFRREASALTRSGQAKAKGERHEKDDRFRLDDRGRYVLGWSNEAKIQALESRARTTRKQLADVRLKLDGIRREYRQLRTCQERVAKLEEFSDFAELDWQSHALAIESLMEEKSRLENASDLLRDLNGQLQDVRMDLGAAAERLEEQKSERAKTEQKRSDAEAALQATRERLEGAAPASAHRDELDRRRAEALGEHRLTVETCDHREQDVRQWLQARIDAEEKKIGRLRESIVDAMRRYRSEFPQETLEADVAVEAAGEYRAMLERLVTDDLPRFESRFKELLNENTIREVVNFQGQLWRERETIKEKVARINDALARIDYNPGRFIRLEAEPTQDAEVRDFQSALRACTEGALAGAEDDQYSEARFLRVKDVIERFRGREGRIDLDARWTAKVTDVRKWFVFAASERWKEDGAEYEHYSDSGGKSGGQKEKLAYTVLAASLAYQFGLEPGEARSRAFRFVVIDEAFGRGSDESAQYGLELFARFNLQLLIVTPLQKIHVIEPFISSLGFVHNDEGRQSRLRNLSIEEYREEKGARAGELDHAIRPPETNP